MFHAFSSLDVLHILYSAEGALTEKWGTGMCGCEDFFFAPFWSFARPPFNSFQFSSQKTFFTPKSQISRNFKLRYSLKIGKKFSSKALNWATIQFTMGTFCKKVQSIRVPNLAVAHSQTLFGPSGCTPIPKWKLSAPPTPDYPIITFISDPHHSLQPTHIWQ